MKVSSLCLSVMICLSVATSAYAQTNNFFGSGLGPTGAGGPANAAASGNIGGPNDGAQGAGQVGSQGGFKDSLGTNVPQGEYSADEKRVQKKYKSNLASARKLVAKGEEMMRSKDEKQAKKGKIIKDIGERRIAELKANNPFPEVASREPKKVN